MRSTTEIAGDLRAAIDDAMKRLEPVAEKRSSRAPAPGKWSAKEIIGHLIDSASNNHQRFVRAQFTDDLVFPGYEQDQWVAVQRYRDSSWRSLLSLWREFNMHLAQVIESTPEEIARKPRTPHNLEEIAFKSVPAHEPATLAYFMNDYVDHLHHHLKQVFAAVADS